ncbi:hypothetical protein KEM54_003803, partial [Ascosphaera aggregata]
MLSNGLVVSPLKSDNKVMPGRSLRDAVYSVDSERDFKIYVLSQSSRVPPAPTGAKYEQHPALAPSKPSKPPSPQPLQTSQLPPAPNARSPASAQQQSAPVLPLPSNLDHFSSTGNDPSSSTIGQPVSQHGGYSNPPDEQLQQYTPISPSAAPQLPPPSAAATPSAAPQPSLASTYAMQPVPSSQQQYSHIQEKGVFGHTLEELFDRDEIAVPWIVFKCIQSIDAYGLDSEGIYRQRGSAHIIDQLRMKFENDPAETDLMNPETFAHDINNVAGLLKQFFKELPNPLLTNELYSSFINASRYENDNQRRDAIHALINDLPDANYATLRALIL